MRRSALVLLSAVLLAVAASGLGAATVHAEEPEKAESAYGRTPDELVPYHRAPEPYRRFFVDPLAYRGPGRAKTASGLDTVRIGLIAPLEDTRDVRAGRSLKNGVELALEQANAAGGHDGVPFELISKNDQALWGASSNTLVELAYDDRVWALIGSIDSNSTHVALRAALKAEVLMVNVGSADPTVTETGIPWLVRCTPDDRQTGYHLAQLLFREMELSRVAVLRSGDRYGRFGVKEFRDAARRLGQPLPMEIQFEPDRTDFTSQLDRLEASDLEAVVLWTRAGQAGEILRQMRARGMSQPVVGTDRLVSDEFLSSAGEAAEGVLATAWMDPTRDDASWKTFAAAYRGRFSEEPDAYASYGYDAARLVIESVDRVGLNRVRIRDDLMGLRTYHGVSGEMQFDPTSNNVAPLRTATVEEGRFVFR